ncbi:hypothetical protein BDZ97DRAFT_1827719 [Flammula alnicola]|nr:hypothetical protein BDZ97DRAFT_1827719 [Flammula alnicola]
MSGFVTMPDVDWLPPRSGDCPCTFNTCPSVIAACKLARLQPRWQAVIVAGKESPTSVFLLKVANATITDPRYRRSGAATIFIRHILQGKTTDGNPHWESSVMGIINVFASIIQTHSEVQDAAIIREVHASYHSILDIIWKDFHFLTGQGTVADTRRAITSKMIGFFARDPDMKRTMYDEKTLKVVLHCWLETAPDSPTRKSPMDTASHMFAFKISWGISLLPISWRTRSRPSKSQHSFLK